MHGEVGMRKVQADSIFAQHEASMKEASILRNIQDENSRLVPNAWLKFTGCASHLSKYHLWR